MPICFPWFGPHATDTTAPGHGFARLLDWTLVEARDDERGATHLAFELTPPAPPSAAWPHAFAATFRVTVGSSLTWRSRCGTPGPRRSRSRKRCTRTSPCRTCGRSTSAAWRGPTYLDKVGGTARRNQGPDPIRFTGETDRVYLNTQAACTIHDPGTAAADRRSRKNGSNATVVWNPWMDKARAMPDFGDDEWPEMVCVETGNVNVHAVTLAAGARHTMTATIDVTADQSAAGGRDVAGEQRVRVAQAPSARPLGSR